MNWTHYQLQENFRCASAICDVANRLIAHQPSRPDKQTISATGQTGEVIVKADGFETEDQEAHAVAEDILLFGDPNNSAVLVRTNWIADFFRGVLKAHGLPVREKPKPDLPEDWQRAKAALALLANPDNDRLAFQAIKLASGQEIADNVRRRALAEYKTINDLALFMPPTSTVSEAVKTLAKMGISRASLDRIGKFTALLPQDSPVNALGLVIGRETVDEAEGQGIRVSTIHSAKGTEAEAVWLPCLEDETIPGSRKDVDIEESRRLLYVGITRAKTRLWLSWAKRRSQQWGEPKVCQPSRFLKECCE